MNVILVNTFVAVLAIFTPALGMVTPASDMVHTVTVTADGVSGSSF